MEYCLNHLRPGQAGTVLSLRASGRDLRRLLDIGLTKGCRVECLHVSPFGDPAAYEVRGAVIALRREDGALVRIAAEPPGGRKTEKG